MLHGVESDPSCSITRRKLEMKCLSDLIDLYIKFFVFDGMNYKMLGYMVKQLGIFIENRLYTIQKDIRRFRKETNEDRRHLQNDFIVRFREYCFVVVERHPHNGAILDNELNHILALIVCDVHSGN